MAKVSPEADCDGRPLTVDAAARHTSGPGVGDGLVSGARDKTWRTDLFVEKKKLDAVIMAKPRRRDVMGKEIYWTGYEPSKVRCAFVFLFCSPSRGQIFGQSAQ